MKLNTDCYVSYDSEKALISIGNSRVERCFLCDIEQGKFFTDKFTNKATGDNWVTGQDNEFRISVGNGTEIIDVMNNAEKEAGQLKFQKHQVSDLEDGGKRLKIVLQCAQLPVNIHLYHEIHPECDWIKRWLGVENNSEKPINIVRYDPEIISIPKNLKAFYLCSWRWGSRIFVEKPSVYSGCGLHSMNVAGRVVSPPTVPTDSPLVLTDQNEEKFLWFFPEIPIKSVIAREDPMSRLYTHNRWDERVPAGKTVSLSAGVITGIGAGTNRQGFKSFRRYLEKQVAGDNLSNNNMLVYNTWYSQGLSESKPDESKCLEQIDECAKLGFDIFVLDAGWHTFLGDWRVDEKKFPNGLKVISDYCHQKGIKFGLWVDSRSASDCSEVYKNHPQWAHKKADGTFYREPAETSVNGHTMVAMCLGSDYGEYLKKRFVEIVKELKLDLLKVDNVCVVSYHDYWKECYAEDHNHLPGRSHKLVWDKWAEIMDAVRTVRDGIIIESIPAGLSLLDKHHLVWIADYQYRPDWLREAYFYRALNYHMTYTHPTACLHQSWPSFECSDIGLFDLMCASLIGGSINCGLSGKIECATEEQKAVLKKWINWRKLNLKYLRVYQHILEDSQPIPLEAITDDNIMRSLIKNWKPSGIDGFAHLLGDGGWVFLFNSNDRYETTSVTLDLSEYGISKFSGITGVSAFDYSVRDNKLRINTSLAPYGYSMSFIQTDCPVRIRKTETEIEYLRWLPERKELKIGIRGAKGQCSLSLITAGMGRPKYYKNCEPADYISEQDILKINYNLPDAMTGGVQGPLEIILRWSE